MVIQLMKKAWLSFHRVHVHLALVTMGVVDDAVDLREERVVGTTTDVLARVEVGAVLTNQDGASGHRLAGEALATEALRVGVTAVTG